MWLSTMSSSLFMSLYSVFTLSNVTCYTFIICNCLVKCYQSSEFLFILVSLSSQFFLPFTGWSLPQDFLGLPSNLYTFIIFRNFNSVNTFFKFFFIFLPLVTNGIFYWCLASILLLYASQS